MRWLKVITLQIQWIVRCIKLHFDNLQGRFNGLQGQHDGLTGKCESQQVMAEVYSATVMVL